MDETSDSTALFRAVTHGKVRSVTSLLESGVSVNIQDELLQTPLIKALSIQKDDVRTHIVRLLLNHGAIVDTQDVKGKTALMYAAQGHGRENIVRLLIRTGTCDPNLQDEEGNTALIYASSTGNASVIRILVNSAFTKHKINVNQTNSNGMSPLLLAFKMRHAECCCVLINEGQANQALVPETEELHRLMNSSSVAGSLTGGRKLGLYKRNSRPSVTSRNSVTSLRLDKISLHSKDSRTSLNSDELASSFSSSYSLSDGADDVFDNKDSKRGKGLLSKKMRRKRSHDNLISDDTEKLIDDSFELSPRGLDGPQSSHESPQIKRHQNVSKLEPPTALGPVSVPMGHSRYFQNDSKPPVSTQNETWKSQQNKTSLLNRQQLFSPQEKHNRNRSGGMEQNFKIPTPDRRMLTPIGPDRGNQSNRNLLPALRTGPRVSMVANQNHLYDDDIFRAKTV